MLASLVRTTQANLSCIQSRRLKKDKVLLSSGLICKSWVQWSQPKSNELLKGPRKIFTSPVAFRKGDHWDDGPCLVTEQEWLIWKGCTVTARVESCISKVYVKIIVPSDGMTLHWGVNQWTEPHRSIWPSGTARVDGKAVQTQFQKNLEGLYEVNLEMAPAMSPDKLVFVLKDKNGNWHNNGGNFSILLKHPTLQDFMEKVVLAESTNRNWSLFNRFCLANELLDTAESEGPEGMGFLFAWLRLSSEKKLFWNGKNSYSPGDMDNIQKNLMNSLAYKVKWSQDKLVRRLARMAMARLPRGGGDFGQLAFGMENIMKENGIKIGQGEGIEEKFLEQWKIKIQNHTTQEDIHICEAYLHFLHTNSIDDFDRTLWERGQISRDTLGRLSQPITAQPLYLPNLIPAFQHYLWVLKTVHSGPDLDVMMEMSKGFIEEEFKSQLYDLLANREAWWAPGRIVECRKALNCIWKSEIASTDVLLLDISLDNQFKSCMDKMDFSSLSGDDLCEVISLTLHNSCLTEESEHLEYCRDIWDKVKNQERWSTDWALLALSAFDSISLALQGHGNEVSGLIETHAEMIGSNCRIPENHILYFAEEVNRQQPLFVLRNLLSNLEPLLQSAAGIGNWQVLSQATARGKLLVRKSLCEVRSKDLADPAVIVTNQISGTELIPEGVVALLGSSVSGVLSGLAVQARNKKVLMASCMDSSELERIKEMEGMWVEASVGHEGQIIVKQVDSGESSPATGRRKFYVSEKSGSSPLVGSSKISQGTPWVLNSNQYTSDSVGQKCLNLAKLQENLPASIQVAQSMALPFDVFDKVLLHPLNHKPVRDFWPSIQRLKDVDLRFSDVARELHLIRQSVKETLICPPELREAVIKHAENLHLIAPGRWDSNHSWEPIWGNLCTIWASKWADHAWLSRRARNVSEESVRVSLLLQQVIPPQYAFALHTADPVTRNSSLLVGEVVSGLGEALVGEYPGRPLTFTSGKFHPINVQVKSLPSKSVGFFSPEPCIVLRSDSSNNDFAGGNMFDNLVINPPQERALDYSQEPLLWDTKYRGDVLRDIAHVGLQVEATLGGLPQDVEGIYSHGRITILQAKPQQF